MIPNTIEPGEGGGGGYTPTDPIPTPPVDPSYPVEIISANQIAADIQSILGDKFTVFVDNNTGIFTDIKRNESIDTQKLLMTKTIPVIFSTSTGELVALKGLFTTSYSFKLDFLVPVEKNIDNTLNDLIMQNNGKLNEIGYAKYMMTFNTASSVRVELTHGGFKNQVSLTGYIAVTSGSFYGNELSIILDDSIELDKLLVSANLSMAPEMTTYETDGDSVTPYADYLMIRNTVSFTLHMRKDSYLAGELFKYLLTPQLLKNKYFKLSLSINGYSEEWNTKIVGMSTVFSVGGYVIMNVDLERLQVIA